VDDSSGEWIAGCISDVLLIEGSIWLIQSVVDWFRGLF
jgi:hypothetical protein